MDKTITSLIARPNGPSPPSIVRENTLPLTDTALWHEQYLNNVYAYARRRVATREEAEDITAEVFAAVCQPTLQQPRSTQTFPLLFLLGIARRKVADANRRRRWREIPLSQMFRRREETTEETASAEPIPEATLLLSERGREIRRLLETLNEAQREALLLHYIEGLSIAEAAQVMQKSPAAVNSLLQRGRDTLYRRGKTYFLNEDSASFSPDASKEKPTDEKHS